MPRRGPTRRHGPNPLRRFQAPAKAFTVTPATVGAQPGAASFTLPNGAAAGAALATTAAGAASFSSALGKATGAAARGAAAGAASFTSPLGKAIGAAGVGRSAGSLSAALAPGSATGAAQTSALAAALTISAAPGSASVPQPATVGAAPGAAALAEAPGGAFVFTVPVFSVGFGSSSWNPNPRPKPADPVVAAAFVAASPGRLHTHQAPGGATGARAVLAGARAAASVAEAAQGGARGGATTSTNSPATRFSQRQGGATGSHNPTDEQLAALLLVFESAAEEAFR